MAYHLVGCRVAGHAADGISVLVRFGTGHIDASDQIDASGGEGAICLRTTQIDAKVIGEAIDANSEYQLGGISIPVGQPEGHGGECNKFWLRRCRWWSGNARSHRRRC